MLYNIVELTLVIEIVIKETDFYKAEKLAWLSFPIVETILWPLLPPYPHHCQ